MTPWDVRNSQALALPDLPSMRKLMLSITACNILPVDSKDQLFRLRQTQRLAGHNPALNMDIAILCPKINPDTEKLLASQSRIKTCQNDNSHWKGFRHITRCKER